MDEPSKSTEPTGSHIRYREIVERGAVNIFLYGTEECFESIGYHLYMFPSGMAEKDMNRILREKAKTDFDLPERHRLSRSMSREDLHGAMRLKPWTLEQVGNIIASGVRYCITAVVNERPQTGEALETRDGYAVHDYLEMFRAQDCSVDLIRLIDSDFMEPIKCLFKAQLYVSATKLTMSMIDTLGFLEFGPEQGVFRQWLNKYADLSDLSVSADELWELRNSLVHMTNLASKRVESGRVERLTFVIAGADITTPERLGGTKVLHLTRLLAVTLPKAIGRWVLTYSVDERKRNQFVHRYDTIVSESRIKAFAARDNDNESGE